MKVKIAYKILNCFIAEQYRYKTVLFNCMSWEFRAFHDVSHFVLIANVMLIATASIVIKCSIYSYYVLLLIKKLE